MIINQLHEYAANYGFKSANLKILIDILGPEHVPPILMLSHDAIKAHLDQHYSAFETDWEKFLKEQGDEKTGLTDAAKATLTNIRKEILNTFKDHPLPESLVLEFANGLDPEDLLMVRSTGMEDSADLANPGGNDSIAAVKNNPKDISTAIGKVIASYFSEKSFEQRLKGNDDITTAPFIPVLVQKMIGESLTPHEGDLGVVSGVMYTGMHGTRIQMAPGHGELIVNSKAPFDSYYVTRENVVHSQIAIKPQRLAPKEAIVNGVAKRTLEMVDNDNNIANRSSVPTSVAMRIAELGRAIEASYEQPMDVEFVYSPATDQIYIVQARPIPKGALKDVLPSTIKPEKIKDVKQHADTLSGQVISSAGDAVQVITSPNEILICQDIELALDIYLGQKSPNIKAVVVRNMAPSTSHEAAEFNSLGIPVIQVDNLDKVTRMSEQDNPCIIIDPQHRMVVDWSSHRENLDDPKVSLFEEPDALLTYGLFKSSMSLQQTITPLEPHEKAKFLELQKAYFALTKIPDKISASGTKINSFNDFLASLETIEASTPERTEEGKLAIREILNKLIALAQNNPFDEQLKLELNQIIQNCLKTSLEIDHLLDTISTLDKSEFGPYQKELLNLVNRIEAILVYPGNKALFSNSLTQLFAEYAATQDAKKFATGVELTSEQLANFTQFLKLKSLTTNESLKTTWAQFALECSQDPEMSKRLAQVVHYMVKSDLGPLLINTLFQRSVHKNGPRNTDEIFKDLTIQVAKVIQNTQALGLTEIATLIDKWQRNEANWDTPANFNKLLKDFTNDFNTILSKLDSIDLSRLGTTEKILVFNEINKLTEVLDNSIKRFKGSQKYTDKDLQAKQFVELLSLYHRLMVRQVSLVSDADIQKFKERIGSDIYVAKAPILDVIAQTFQDKAEAPTPEQMSSSRKFSVKSAIITSPASFERQFVDKIPILTLEDMFTLFHQNIIAANTVLTQELNLTPNELPPVIQDLLKSINEYKLTFNGEEFPANLVSSRYNYPVYQLEFNIPLAMHASTFTVTYDEQTNKMNFAVSMFGEARDRFQKIEDFTKLYLEMMGADVTKSPGFSTERSMLECGFSITPDSPEAIFDASKLVKMMARISFSDNTYSIADVIQMAENYPDRIEQIEMNLSIMLNNLASKKGFGLKLHDALALIHFCQTGNISDATKNTIFRYIKKYVPPPQWATQEGSQGFARMAEMLNRASFMDDLATEKFGASSFLELALRAKNYELAHQIIASDKFVAKEHPQAIGYLLMDPNIQLDLIKKLCDKGATSTSPKISILNEKAPELYAKLQENNSNAPPSTRSSLTTGRPRRLPGRN